MAAGWRFRAIGDGNFEIYVIGADGTGENRLTFNTARDSYPSWTADGRILFESDRDGDGEI
jgi:Tol biopolymer transport system component